MAQQSSMIIRLFAVMEMKMSQRTDAILDPEHLTPSLGFVDKLLHASAVVAQDFTLLTQMLRVLLALVRYVQSIRLL